MTAWREVDGIRLPVPVAGHAALELCNTRAGWNENHPGEYLCDLRPALLLAVDLGLMPKSARPVLSQAIQDHPAQSRRLYARLLGFRSDLYAVVTGGASAAELERLDAAMVAARTNLHFLGLTAEPVWSRDWDSLESVLEVFVEAAEHLLRNHDVPVISACPGSGCGWVFLNPIGRRRWCRMQWCGNRAKARRHAARVAADITAIPQQALTNPN
jgi:CGNR zinc finger